jgi:gluconokinase
VSDKTSSDLGLHVIVVMGVAGAGKTVVGRALSDALCWTFYDADDFHPAANIEKMHDGHPLTDDDRRPWLATLSGVVADVIRRDTHAILACSALKEWYRAAILPRGAPPSAVRYVYLDVAKDVLRERLRERQHFFPPELLDSQLSTLEKPGDAVWVDGAQPVRDTVAAVREALDV